MMNKTININEWIKNINRLFIPRPTKKVNKRFDMAERTIDFPDKYYNNFLKTLKQEDFITYPSYADYNNLKSQLGEYNGLKEENVYLSAGSGACLKSLCEVTVSEGYNVVSNVPCYPMYGIYAKIYGGEHIGVDYPGKPVFSLDNLISKVNDKTRLVIVANPNSPMGDYKTIEDLKPVCEFLKNRNIVFMIDEAYVDFGPGSVLPLIDEYDNVVISRTFSKAFGAAGIRVGYLLGNKNLINIITKVQLTYPLTGVSVKFASFLLSHNDEVKNYAKKTKNDREKLCDLLESLDYDVVRSHTNSIHFHESNGDNTKTIEKLKSAGLAFKSGDKATGTPVRIPGDERETWIRLSVGPDIDKIIGDII